MILQVLKVRLKMVNKLFTFQVILFYLLFFSSKILAQNVCNKEIGRPELKERLINLQKIRDDAERGIMENKKILMKAQEIILLARTRGDVEAGQIAEEAARKAQETINKYRKNKEQAENEIIKMKEILQLMEKK